MTICAPSQLIRIAGAAIVGLRHYQEGSRHYVLADLASGDGLMLEVSAIRILAIAADLPDGPAPLASDVARRRAEAIGGRS